MCGIFFCLRTDLDEVGHIGKLSKVDFDRLCANLRESNAERGPDCQSSVIQHLSDKKRRDIESFKTTAEFYASELHLRGDAAVLQPHQKDGNILCWNGEIFSGIQVSAQENDGIKLMEELASVKEADEIIDVFGRLEGPYAFVYYHATSRRVYFSRDPLGRRSLLVHKPTLELPLLLLCSVSSGKDQNLCFEEVSTEGIHCLDMESFEKSMDGKSDFVEAFDNTLSQLPRRRLNGPSDLPYAEASRINDTLTPDDFPRVEALNRIPEHLQKPVNDFLEVLEESTRLQVRDIPQTRGKGSARVSVLFSGGIDCTIVAYLAHKHVPLDEPIDLFNVGFENPRKTRIQRAGKIGVLPKRQQKREKALLEDVAPLAMPSYRVPDRVTGLQELEELRRLCPGRTWNFLKIEVNVPYEESQKQRERVEMLMLPSRTVMDLSLALALYFAAAGKGQVRSHPTAEPVPYTSPARVVLSGLGSDELLGGYSRHRSAYNTGGWPAVIGELQLEIDRIPTRNLGRDDRIISSHGKETRYPFLSLDVVFFLARLPVHYKLDPSLDAGKGDKMLLRLLVNKLGLVEASSRKKRAMQFGSHSAHMDGEKKGDAALRE